MRNFKNSMLVTTLGCAFRTLAGFALLGSAGLACAAATDIADAPFANTTSSQLKPNIMLLMDTSNSMRFSHMPDEIEGTNSGYMPIGYKSYQCNVLYYNPYQTYEIPKDGAGTVLPTPSFTAARYNYYSTDASTVNLSTSFQAYDTGTRQYQTVSDAAQPAYYYLHKVSSTVSTGLTYQNPPCTDPDPGSTVAASGGGTWERVIVSSTSGPGGVDERQNYAIWYTFYRTRISLIKSAVSLAFTPLTDSYRVGLITVKPDLTGTANYLPIADFDATQRVAWFNKLFEQTPGGSSPSREALARVGRHYSGKQDYINTGMTGDPVQYSCQQNFTIMTTDGYWNVAQETSGPVRIDGVTLVGQQDGSLDTVIDSTHWTQRPIWDGGADTTRVITDATTQYQNDPCTSPFFERTTTQTLRSTTQNRESTTQNLQSTVQNLQSTVQNLRTQTQNRESTTQNRQSTVQNLVSTVQNRRSTVQNLESTTQITQTTTQTTTTTRRTTASTVQNLRSTTQNRESTVQNRQSTVQNLKSTVQNLRNTSQIVKSTTQNRESTVQNRQSTVQNLKSTSQITQSTAKVYQSTTQNLQYNATTELTTPVLTCTPAANITCSVVNTGPTLVASCTPSAANAGNLYKATTCSTTATGPTGVASCTPAAASSGNGYTTTTCNTVTTTNVPAATCTAAAASSGNSYTATTCSTANVTTNVPVQTCTAGTAGSGAAIPYLVTTCSTNNTTNVPVASCTPQTAASGNSWVTRTCSTNNTTNVPVASCTASAATSGNSWTATTCPAPITTTNVPVATCTAAAASSGNSYTTTTCPAPITTTNVPSATCTAAAASSGNSYTTTTCSTANVTTNVPVQTCTAGTAGSGAAIPYLVTTCSTNNTTNVPVASCTPQTAASGNSWVTRTCSTNNTTNVPVASCTASAATSGNSWTTTTCPAPITTTNVPVASCTPQTAASGNSWVTRTCTGPTILSGPTVTNGCTAAAPVAGNGYVETVCGTITNTVGVASCTPQAPTAGNNWTTITCGTNNTTNVPVASCTPQTAAAGNNWVTRTCSTNNTTNVPVATCTAAAASSGNSWTTTTCPAPVTTGPTPAATCSPAAAAAGNSYTATTCSTANVTTNVPVQTCTAGTAGSGAAIPYLVTTCSTNNTTNVPVASCTPQTAASGNSWVTRTCPAPSVTGPTPVATCTPAAAASGNSWTATTCSTANVTTNVPVASCTPVAAAAGNSYVATTCSTANVTTNVAVQTCSPSTAGSGAAIPYLVTTCSTNNTTNVAVASCTPQTAASGNSWVTRTCSTNNTTNVPVASCTPQTASSGNSWTTRTCSTNNTGPTDVAAPCVTTAASAGNSYTATTCTPEPGKKLQKRIRTTVETRLLSGGPTGFQLSSSTTTTSTPFTDVDGICHPDNSSLGAPLGYPPADAQSTTAEAPPPSGCSAWPCTVDTVITGGSSNSLADVAQYYYVTDLRPTMDNDVRTKGSGAEDDRAKHQHMTTFTLALGVSGSLNYSKTYKTDVTGDFARIRCDPLSGGCNNTCTASDPSYPNCTPKSWPVWPDPTNYDYASDGGLYSNPRSIDDFWHTAVNGRGLYFSASDPNSVVNGLQTALAGIQALTGSASAAATSNLEPIAGDNFVYRSSYTTQEWVGEISAYTINPTTGVLDTTPTWQAQGLLDARVGNGCDNRQIHLFRAGATNNLVNFTWNTKQCDGANQPTGTASTGLNASEQAYFGASSVAQLSQYPAMSDGSGSTVNQRTAAAGANLVNYVRGHHNMEGPALFKTNDLATLYRTRSHVLGDFVNAQPAYVKGPFASYADTDYATFKASNSSRTPMIYAGANDGMLHAFNATTGAEAWAFIPSTVLPNLFKLSDNNYANSHQFYVDGSPTVGDTYDGTDWKTVLVGGLNKGGKGYYAVDVTDPANPKGLWEFTWSNTCWDGVTANVGADCHLGYTFGRPIITKLQDGTWVVMVTSGINNVNVPVKAGDGVGYLYVLNAATGKLISKISTGVGSDTTPSGLTQINNFVDNTLVNNTTLRVYGVDMLGNIWRFDVNDTIFPSGIEASLIGTAKDATNNPQPITTRPELGELDGYPWVYVGTGRLLGLTDLPDTQTQSVYGFKDPLAGSPAYSDLRGSLRSLAMTQVGSGVTAYRTIACTGSCSSTNGWYVDLPDSGERVNIDLKLQLGTITFASNVPSNSACSIGGYSWLNFMDYRTGLAVATAVDHAAARRLTNSLAVGTNVLRLETGKVIVLVIGSDNTPQVQELPVDTPPPAGKRVSWREVLE